jgi:uncharacterized protein YkwD
MKLSQTHRTLLLAVSFAAFVAGAHSHASAQADPDDPKQILLEDLNQSRTEAGLKPLSLDPNLAIAAQRHADLMASTGELSHNLPDEAGLAERCAAAGAHFSSIAENIAEGGAIHSIHQSWMQSQAHHDNILSPTFTSAGIGVAKVGRRYYAVEDFSTGVAAETPEAVEQRVRDMLAIRNIDPNRSPKPARAMCASGDRAYNGPGEQPALVIQFASPDVDKLGPVLDQRLKPGMYHAASVGACGDTDPNGFTKFKLALLLY